jgi:hypothetical protein
VLTAILDACENSSGKKLAPLQSVQGQNEQATLISIASPADDDLELRHQEELELKRKQAATKADEAEVPVYI